MIWRRYLLFCLLLLPLPVSAAEVVTLRAQPVVDISGQVEVLHDPQGKLDIESVAAGRGGSFNAAKGPLVFGYRQGAVWIRFSVNRSPESPSQWWLEVGRPGLDHVTLFAAHEAGGWQAETLGDHASWSGREVKSRTSIFPIEIPDHGAKVYFLRIASTSAISAWVNLWQPSAYLGEAARETMLLGGYLLTVILVTLINLIQWRSMRERLYLVYALYILAGAGALLVPEGLLHFIADWHAPLHLESLLNLCQSFYFALLSLVFLDLVGGDKVPPWMRRGLIGMAMFFLLGQVAAQIAGVDHVIKPWMLKLGFVAMLLILLAAVWLALRGGRMARFFVVAFFPILLSSQQSILMAFGMLQGLSRMNALPMIAMLMHMVLMQLLVNSRIRKVRLEHEQSLARALVVEKQASEKLASEVESRTRELRETNDSLQQTQLQLEQALRQEKLFLGMVAHEFRTPLAVIDASAQLLGIKIPPEDANNTVLGRIRRGSHRLTLLLDNFLTRGRIDSGGMVIRCEPLMPQALAEWAQETAELLSEQHHVVIERRGDNAPFEGDPQLIRILLANLLSNAFKYAPADTNVTLRILREAETCRFEIQDQGPGIPPDEQSLLFQPYHRGADVGSQPGAGLGLAIVRGIAELHHGRVEVASATGQGTCFMVTLPAMQSLAIN